MKEEQNQHKWVHVWSVELGVEDTIGYFRHTKQVMNSERPLVPIENQESARPMSLVQPPVYGIVPSMANQGNLGKF